MDNFESSEYDWDVELEPEKSPISEPPKVIATHNIEFGTRYDIAKLLTEYRNNNQMDVTGGVWIKIWSGLMDDECTEFSYN